jgi:hypothetical protein
MTNADDFYEADEPGERITAIFASGEKGVTSGDALMHTPAAFHGRGNFVAPQQLEVA